MPADSNQDPYEKCASCGEPATRRCGVAEQFPCGWPLCDLCRHNDFDNDHARVV